MNVNQSDWLVTSLLVILGISIFIAVVVIAKTIITEAKEKKAKEARLQQEERSIPHEPQVQAAPKAASKAKPKAKPAPAKKQKDDVDEDDDLVAAAEVYLTYELKEQAITTLEKHLLKNPTDEKALALLKKAEAST